MVVFHFLSKFQAFSSPGKVNDKIPGFPGFPGRVDTLIINGSKKKLSEWTFNTNCLKVNYNYPELFIRVCQSIKQTSPDGIPHFTVLHLHGRCLHQCMQCLFPHLKCAWIYFSFFLTSHLLHFTVSCIVCWLQTLFYCFTAKHVNMSTTRVLAGLYR